MKWEMVKLGDVVKVVTGKYDVNHSVENGSYPFFTCAMKPFRSETYSFDGELILLPGNGANVGEVMYYNGKCEAYQRTYVLHEMDVYPKYLYYYLTMCWKRVLENQQFGSATNYIRLNNITDLQIPLPALATQRRISEILDKADALRRKDRELLAKYDELAQSIFMDMFGDPVRNEKGWEMGTIRDISKEVKYGTSSPAESEGEYPYLRMNNITFNGEWDFKDLKYINVSKSELEKYKVQKGDIVFNRTNSKELVGKTAVYEESEIMIIAGYLIRVRVNELGDPHYVSGFLNSKVGKSILRNLCKNIIGMANINAQELQDIPLPIPPLKLQSEYNKRVSIVRMQKRKLLSSMIYSEEIFQSLLQKAFKGELTP